VSRMAFLRPLTHSFFLKKLINHTSCRKFVIWRVRNRLPAITFRTPTAKRSDVFFPNLQKKKFYIPETQEWVTLKVSASAIRTINKLGIYTYIKKLEKKGDVAFYSENEYPC